MTENIFKDFIVKEINEKIRLDRWLAQEIKSISRSKIQDLIKNKKILLNGKPCQGKDKLSSHDKITLLEDPKESTEIKILDYKLDLDVIYEDKYLLVINKPAGLSVHPSISQDKSQRTLVEALLNHCKDHQWTEKDYASLRPGIVHRLDKQTTGVMVWAKDQKTLENLSQQFKERKTKKTYLALLTGDFEEKKIIHESYLTRDPKNKTRFISLSEENITEEEKEEMKWAKSTFRKEKSFLHKYCLCSIEIHTGRTHQIRAQAKELGFPVLGDQIYNPTQTLSKVLSSNLKKLIEKTQRQMLHAHKLSFVHPENHETMEFEAKIPEDFQELLNLLEQS